MSRYRKLRPLGQPEKAGSVPALPNNLSLVTAQRAKTTDTVSTSLQNGSDANRLNPAQQEAFDILTGKVDRQKDSLQKQLQDERARREAMADTFRQKRADEEAGRSAEKGVFPRQYEKSIVTHHNSRLHKEKLGYSTSTAKPSDVQPSHKDHTDHLFNAIGDKKQSASVNESEAAAHSLGFDAPKSAVNAGSRVVKVLCSEISFNLSIDPSSTPLDLLLAAKERLGEGFDPHHYVVMESFKQLGLERPLRHYEHIRDVLNSWDRDDQNVLLILPAHSQWNSESLEFEHTLKSEPCESSATLYHSQKPRSWDKRSLTLRPDGQILIQKYADSEAKNICHMSDFDVYMPTPAQMKKIRPPRKYCFAIKSQQKSAMFLDTANFVHFVCTKDKNVAMEWYRSVHGWRSWYMVTSLGLGKTKSLFTTGPLGNPHLVTQINRISAQSFSSESQQRSPANSEDRIFPNADLVSSPAAESPRSVLTSRTFNNRGGPPVSYPRRTTGEAERRSSKIRARSSSRTRERVPSFGAEPFAEGGLLGRTYTLRQQALKVEQEEPTVVPMTSTKPLLDFNGGKEVILGGQQGHGVTLDHVPTGGLISAAANAEKFYAPSQEIEAQVSGLNRSLSRRGRSATIRQAEESAFTGGLLSHAGEGQGGRRQGRGAQCGARDATSPLLDMSEGSTYIPGSLLSKVEDKVPVVQREKMYEISTRTGGGV